MTKANRKVSSTAEQSPLWLDEVLTLLKAGKAVRKDFDQNGRLHIDRPLPFLCVHIEGDREGIAARDIASAHASYLVVHDVSQAVAIVSAVGNVLKAKFGAFMLLDIDELEHDTLIGEDAPYLPPFEIRLSSTDDAPMSGVLRALREGLDKRDIKFRTPDVRHVPLKSDGSASTLSSETGFPVAAVRYAPIYREPGSGMIYPDLRERLIANIFDAGLKAFAAFVGERQGFKLTTHRALGRKAFVDAVVRADRAIDDVASSFDFLLAITPINADAAFSEFRDGGCKNTPRLFYRPLALQVEVEKRKLFSVAFDRFEDPVLYHLYREKQRELDLQLTMISERETGRFVEFGRALYGPVEASLLNVALDVLKQTEDRAKLQDDPTDTLDRADCFDVEQASLAMIAQYQNQYADFDAVVELREDLPSGLMVSGNRLLVSRHTSMRASRVAPLLSHEIGVHLLTYFNGSAQGLRLFRSGLAGYEGMQEGLAVFSEYMSGGMTVGRLRLIAARVVACHAMLAGRSFAQTFDMLVNEYQFAHGGAFNITLRLYRGGGLAKDAIYLRGLLELLAHLKSGGALDPFWMGKISASHFKVMEELGLRGLLKAPVVRPDFLQQQGAQARLEKARAGLSPVEMIIN